MTTREQLNYIAEDRIIILDGAMGSVIQVLNLDEKSYRGAQFADHPSPLIGCNDLLCLTRPGAIGAIHDTYLEAGADIIETCSFNSTSISLADYGLAHLSYEISEAAAKIARKSADRFSSNEQKRFVAGSLGPTAKGASLYPDVNNPSKRSVTWDELEEAYYDSARGLLDGGADILLIETIFDTLNAKAALCAISRIFNERKIDVPIMISASISNDAGRLLSGQSLEAFLISVCHCAPAGSIWSIGLNCSFSAPKLLPHLRQLSEISPCLVHAYPNAGVPNKFGRYEEVPEIMAENIEPFFEERLVNIIGGCCGSTPAHIVSISQKANKYEPRQIAMKRGYHFWGEFSGLEPFRIPHNTVKLRDSDESAETIKLKSVLIDALANGDYEDAADIARDIIESTSTVLNIEITDTKTINKKALNAFLDYALMNPYVAKTPIYINCVDISILKSVLKRLQGRCLAGPISMKDGAQDFLSRLEIIRQLGGAAVVNLMDGRRKPRTYDQKVDVMKRIYQLLQNNKYPVDNIVINPEVPQDDPFCKWLQVNCPGVILGL